MTVFRWRSHETVFIGCRHTNFAFVVFLTFSVTYAIYNFPSDVHKTFKANSVRLLT